MIWCLVCFIIFYFAPVRLIRFALFTFHGEVFLALLLVDILKSFVPGSFPGFIAARADFRKQRREQYKLKQICA